MKQRKLIADIGIGLDKRLIDFTKHTGMTKTSIVKAALVEYLHKYDLQEKSIR